MKWQVRTEYGRWLAKDILGFHTTSQEKALKFDSRDEAEQAAQEAGSDLPLAELELVEVP